MNVTIARIDKTLPLPAYESAGAVAFDLTCRTETIVAPHSVALLPTNIIVEVPKDFALLLSSRSSTARRKNLLVPLGIIDQDYHGPQDELLLQVVNFSDTPVTVERGERVGQALLVSIAQATWQEGEEMTAANRGGFGTTGTHSQA